MLQEKVARLRQLMSEATPSGPSKAEAEARHAFQLYELNYPRAPLVVAQSPRARMQREIERIAAWYGWTSEVIRALDAHQASTMDALDDDAISALFERMRMLEDCAQQGCDSPDSPPAR